MNDQTPEKSPSMPDSAVQIPASDSPAVRSDAWIRITADDGSESWTIRCDAPGRAIVAADLDSAIRDGRMPEGVGQALRRQLAWTARPGVQIEPKPVIAGGLRISVHLEPSSDP